MADLHRASIFSATPLKAESGRGTDYVLHGISHPEPVWFEGADGGASEELKRLVLAAREKQQE